MSLLQNDRQVTYLPDPNLYDREIEEFPVESPFTVLQCLDEDFRPD